MNNITAIFKKQLLDTLKNKTVLIQFLMFPVLTVIMNNAVKIEGMPKNFFVNLFAAMFVGMAPLTSMASIIAEEKEQSTLKILVMSGVRPYEYLIGVGSYVWIMCMAGSAVIAAAGNYEFGEAALFLCIMAAGILASLLIGGSIGVVSKTQMAATSVTVPVMVIFAFLPMLSMFNESIEKIARFTYSEQISRSLAGIGSTGADMKGIGIVAANIIVFAVIFFAAYEKNGLESD
ncbi:MAG: ABC transporter permease [Oscillospiraceae bacterium]|nr:ABC transporter permease [Oscillospiraceae bacterium]